MNRISIIVPVYNVEKYLQKCVDSIFAQTFTDFELLLVDDGTPDKSAEVCDENAIFDERSIVVHKGNGGVSEARNVGIEFSNGESLTFVDSDDFVMPKFLDKIMQSDAELVLQTTICVDENGNVNFERIFENKIYENLSSENIAYLLKMGNVSYLHGKRFNRRIVKVNNISFYPKIDFAEDTLFMVQYCLLCKTASVENIANYCYVSYSSRQTLSNILTYKRIEMFKKANKMIADIVSSDDKNLSEDLFIERMEPFYRSVVANLMCRKEKSFYKRFLLWEKLQKDECFNGVLIANSDFLDKHYLKAMKSNSTFKLFCICLYGEIAHMKANITKKLFHN